jgi:diguanylate cyclase
LAATGRRFRIAEIGPHQPCVVIPARPAEAQRLLGASIDENRLLTAHVRRLEAELRGSSAEVAKLRGQLRGAVQDALTDSLTGLANRRSFDLELAGVVARTGTSSPAHLVIADVDHFKHVNDTQGHDIGDEVLRIVGEVLLANVRRDSLVARLGGDEFGLLLPRASPRYAAGIAIRLSELLASRPLAARGRPEIIDRITLSIGVPLGIRAKAVPTGMHAPMRRRTRRNAAAATESASHRILEREF